MIYELRKLDLNTWLASVCNFRDYSFTQYWEYSKAAAQRIGAVSEHIGLFDHTGKLVMLTNVRIKILPFNLGGIAYISGGMMLDQGAESIKDHFSLSIEALKKEYVQCRGYILRISPRRKLINSEKTESELIELHKFKRFSETNSTILIDLSKDIADIRKTLHQKWRNILNRGEKMAFELVTCDDHSLFPDFEELFDELVTRKGFKVDMGCKFYSKVQLKSDERERFHLSMLYFNGKPVSGNLASICGDTSVYLLGATNNAGRKIGASYLLQWHTIIESKKRGCSWYDLGGVDKIKNPNVYKFKKRMGGIEIEKGTEYQFQSGLKGKITILAERLYKKIINL